jgi:hypothetical protein
MEQKHIEEIKNVIEQASNGQWIPAAVVASLMSVVVVLLLVIYKKDKKDSEIRHKDAEKRISKIEELNQNMVILVNRHDVEIDNLKNAS